MLADSFPLLNVFWTMLEFVAFVVWIWLLIVVFGDIFRSRDMGGWAKAIWVLFVFVFPLLGVLVYLIARGDNARADRGPSAATGPGPSELHPADGRILQPR